MSNNSITVSFPYKQPRSRYGMVVHKDWIPLPLKQHEQKDLEKLAISFANRITTGKCDILMHPSAEFSTTHYSYPYYLYECFANHYGCVVSPDYLWFTALISFAKYVNQNSELVRKYFVDFEGKKKVRFEPGTSNRDEWLATFLGGALPMLKIDRGLLFPQFSTSNDASRVAMQAAVGDLISPYITGAVCMCGIPSVTVEGSTGDYDNMATAAKGIAGLFAEDEKTSNFWNRISEIALKLKGIVAGTEKETDFLQQIFDAENCSSGSPVYEIQGWITDFMQVDKKERRRLLLKDAGFLCAVTKFEQEWTPRMLMCLAGVFASNYDAEKNILRPRFDRFWIEYDDVPLKTNPNHF
eukprot:TRINITY_DN6612_c0_g1_i1.p1 TRINITY_DN6612_c0_g1~~TRINITY_DN6612_c0_g1_i1.p1  ORF type:complete len:354 (+),score=71.96 TRINITY_DN6612_c0_g1_i1:103-1164(+)